MADEILPSAPIDQFDEATSVQPEDWAVIFQISTGKTKKTRSSNFGLDSPSSNYNWSPTFDYAVDEVVEFQGKWYKSLDTPNLGNVPSAAGSLFWEETSKNSSSSLVKWAAGTYITDDVFVVYDDNQDPADPAWRMYALKNATRPFLSADFAVELAAGDWVAFVGGSELFKGIFASEAALISAWPDADPGNYAYVDAGPGDDVILYLWDDDDAAWIEQGNVTVAAWSDTDPGTVERSVQAEAEAIPVQALAGATTGLSDARTPSEIGLYHMLRKFVTLGWTWTAQQTDSIGRIVVDATASTMAGFSAGKKLISIAWATSAEIITGTDATKPINSAALAGSNYALKSYVDAAVTGLLDFRGNFDASGGAWPTSASPNPGSGVAGAVLKADWWVISVAGTLPTGVIVDSGDWIASKIDTPGNTGANWTVVNVNMLIAAIADINTGTDDAKYITPLGLQGSKYETQYGLRTFVNGTTGTNTYAGNLVPAITTYGSGGLKISIKFTNANTTASTIAINGLAAVPLVKLDGSALIAGDIPANSTKFCIYDGTSLIVLNPSTTPVTFASDAETITGTSTTKATNPANIAAWWTDQKTKTQTWSLKQTFASANRYSALTALDVMAVDSNKDLIGKSFATLASDIGVEDETLNAVAISAGTLTLAWGSAKKKWFDLTTTVSANFTLAFTGSNMARGRLFMRVTGTIVITCPAAVIMDLYESSVGRWNLSGDQLTIIGVTASPFYLTLEKDASGNIWLHVTNRGV